MWWNIDIYHHGLDLSNEDQEGAGPLQQFVTDKAEERQAGTAAAKSPVEARWQSIVILSYSALFVLGSDPASVSKRVDIMVSGEMPGLMILTLYRPLALVDVVMASGESEWTWVDDESLFWRHVQHSRVGTSVTRPQCRWSLVFKDFNIGNKVTSVDFKDSGEAHLVKLFEKP